MMITLRLYRQHDLDLIALYRHPSFSLSNAMKTALCAFVRNECFSIKQPEPYELGDEKISKIVQMHISLSDSTEGDVIKWLKNIKEGYRNSVLKNIIRGYIAGPCIYAYMIDVQEGISQSSSLISEFEDNTNNLVEVKGRNKRSVLKKSIKADIKTQETSVADEVLSGKKDTTKPKKVFVERIADDDVDTAKLEEITKPDQPTTQNIEESKPVKPSEVKQNETSNDSSNDDFDLLSAFDEMMDSF